MLGVTQGQSAITLQYLKIANIIVGDLLFFTSFNTVWGDKSCTIVEYMTFNDG